LPKGLSQEDEMLFATGALVTAAASLEFFFFVVLECLTAKEGNRHCEAIWLSHRSTRDLGSRGCLHFHVVSTIVKETVKEVLNAELFELRRRSIAAEDRLEVIDRKVSAILRDALEQRRARS